MTCCGSSFPYPRNWKAAHPMSPIRAQGINMALRDAVVAANHLVPALHAGAPTEQVLSRIQSEREVEIVRAQTLQLREARGQRWARERPWLMKPMLSLLPVLTRPAFVKQWMAASWFRQQRELRHGVTKVELRV
jgi:2-polyprenyl-6-methoxyphenol hydroxylase-like FAD-dependent oxidoreductase